MQIDNCIRQLYNVYCQKVYAKGVGLSSLSDSELITQILCLQPPDGVTPNNWPDRIKRLMHLTPTSYSLAILHNDAIYAVRDPHGNRPLCIGRIMKYGSVSRSSSFDMPTAHEREQSRSDIIHVYFFS